MSTAVATHDKAAAVAVTLDDILAERARRGGRAWAASRTPAERHAQASKAARARQDKRKAATS